MTTLYHFVEFAKGQGEAPRPDQTQCDQPGLEGELVGGGTFTIITRSVVVDGPARRARPSGITIRGIAGVHNEIIIGRALRYTPTTYTE